MKRFGAQRNRRHKEGGCSATVHNAVFSRIRRTGLAVSAQAPLEERGAGRLVCRSMQVNDARSYWETLMSTLKTSNAKPPWSVLYAAAGLVGQGPIDGAWTVYRPEEPPGQTTWSTFIVSAGRLVHVEARFDAERHALNENNNSPVPVTIVAAWVRRLADITAISIGAAETTPPTNAPPAWFGVADVAVTFADGTHIVVAADQRRLGDSDQARSDRFLTALQSGAGL